MHRAVYAIRQVRTRSSETTVNHCPRWCKHLTRFNFLIVAVSGSGGRRSENILEPSINHRTHEIYYGCQCGANRRSWVVAELALTDSQLPLSPPKRWVE